MEPAQYTGKTNATQGEPAAGESPLSESPLSESPLSESPLSASVPSPAPTSVAGGATVTPPPVRAGGNFVRLVSWGAVLAVLAAGLVMYFRYERTVVPLFGRGR